MSILFQNDDLMIACQFTIFNEKKRLSIRFRFALTHNSALYFNEPGVRFRKYNTLRLYNVHSMRHFAYFTHIEAKFHVFLRKKWFSTYFQKTNEAFIERN